MESNRPEDTHVSPPRRWKIESIDGKGLGAVAAEHITAGTELFSEAPVFILSPSVDQQESISRIDKLSETNRQAVLSLYNSFPELGSYGIVKTNVIGLGCSDDNEPRPSGLFLVLSRFNHSCVPNCERWWNEEKRLETLYSLKDIQPGEELTIHYTDICSRRSTRQEYFNNIWRFECRCNSCQLKDEEQVRSDTRRESVKRILSSIGSINTRAELKRAQMQVKIAVQYTREEGIRGALLARIGYDGYQISLLAGNVKEAKNYVEMAYKEYVLGTGPGSAESRKMKRYLEDPKSHRNWTLRGFFA